MEVAILARGGNTIKPQKPEVGGEDQNQAEVYAANQLVANDAIESRLPASSEFTVASLSSGEKIFLERLVEGCSYTQIAHRMNITTNTVRSYVRTVYKKLRVHSRTQAVVKYLRTDH